MTTSLSRILVRVLRPCLFVAVLAILPAASVRAQIGNDNPTGVSGTYNGNVTSAGSYDPYTGNATRSVTDITVAGAVGKYPLAFTRTMNSRYTPGAGTLEFGQAGTWRHNYQWSIDNFTFQSNAPDKWYAMPLVYTVNYPDGRRLSFYNSNNDTMMRSGSGISDRFLKPAGDYDYCYLLLPDGGKIWFAVEISRWGDDFGPVTISCNFTFMGIIDPHGQTTTVTQNGNTTTITEPRGRTLTLSYITTPWNGDTVLSSVTASDGRSVIYNYGGYQPVAGGTLYSALGNVQYRDTQGASYTQAIYAYQPDNVDPNGRPLIRWAIDPMYSGPMWAIGYNFVPGSSGGVYGQLQSENYLDPRTGTVGVAVSTLSANGASRTETRGDGFTRTFNYSGGKLANYTDFGGHTSSISYDGYGYIGSVTDARGNTTTMVREGTIGAISRLIHPDQSYVGYSYAYENGGPYHVQIRGDERGHNTYFTRDPGNFQLTRIDYPDYPNGAYETFAYNGFGQVYSHRTTSGAIETFYIDGRGMTYASNNPDGTTYYYYDGQDRLEHVTDPRSNTTWFQYNARGQVTRVTHADGTFVQTAYDNHGNKISVTDELNHTTTYAYDDYNRLVSSTNPLNQTTSYNYAQDWVDSYLQTSSNPKGTWLPSGRGTHYAYDGDWHRTILRAAPGTADDAWTFYGYDAAGNLTSVQDPRGNVTEFGYDNRNRKIWMNDPMAAHRNASGHTTEWQYDAMGHKTKEIRADNAFRNWEYDDPMGRVTKAIDWRMNTAEPEVATRFWRSVTSTQLTITDPQNAVSTINFDLLQRKISQVYPADVSGSVKSEEWGYDAAGNLDHHRNRAGALQQYQPYDSRNRPTSYTWNDGTQGLSFEYDAASRLTALHNAEADIAFGYDAANRRTNETETIKSYGLNQTHTVTYEHNADGKRSRLVYPEGWDYRYSYTNRNQLANIQLAWAGTPTVQYTYDVAGNRSRRTIYYGAYTDYTYNAINQLYSQSSYFANGYIARFDYGFDAANRITYEQRNSSVADGFDYDARNEVTGYRHDGVVNQNGTVTGGYNIGISYDANGNRIAATEDCCVAPYNAAPNNQYVSDWTGTLSYDSNANLTSRAGWSFSYDAQNRLVMIQGGSTVIRYHYDPLNRIVARETNGDITTQVWDGWNLIEERAANNAFKRMFFHGPTANEIVGSYGPAYGDAFYFQDGRGNVTHATGPGNNVIEHYTYFPLFGQPTIDDGYGNLRSSSILDNRFLFKGALFVPGPDIYDMRNRFYLPNLGRFMQSDPIGFAGGDVNLFRYVGNDPVNRSDPSGLLDSDSILFSEDIGSTPGVVVFGTGVETANSAGMGPQGPAGPLDFSGGASGEGSSGDGGRGDGNSGTPDESTPPEPPSPQPQPPPTPSNTPTPPTPTSTPSSTPTPWTWNGLGQQMGEGFFVVGGLSYLLTSYTGPAAFAVAYEAGLIGAGYNGITYILEHPGGPGGE